MSEDRQRLRPSRRQFLAGMGVAGAGAVATSMGAGAALSTLAGGPAAASGLPHALDGAGAPVSPTLFGRMFPSLPPFADTTDTVRAYLAEVGKAGGILDAGDK